MSFQSYLFFFSFSSSLPSQLLAQPSILCLKTSGLVVSLRPPSLLHRGQSTVSQSDCSFGTYITNENKSANRKPEQKSRSDAGMWTMRGQATEEAASSGSRSRLMEILRHGSTAVSSGHRENLSTLPQLVFQNRARILIHNIFQTSLCELTSL